MKNDKKRPPWLKVRVNLGEDFRGVEKILQKWSLNTVCREAGCPNISECFNQKTATFLILGDICTRNCAFCGIKKGSPRPLDPKEPERIARAIKEMGLLYVVITSVTRDDLPDGGARAFAHTIQEIKRENPHTIIEVLISDLQGSKKALDIILHAAPHILGHNLETVSRLYYQVRPEARYERSLNILRIAKESSSLKTKSGLLVGLGEEKEEILKTMDDLRGVEVDIFTLGQYLPPTMCNLPVKKYYHPQEFEEFIQEGRQRSFKWIEAGPLVRSSFHAKNQWEKSLRKNYGS